MRRSAVASRLAASRLAASPNSDATHLGKLRPSVMRRPAVTSWAGRFTSPSSPTDVVRPGPSCVFFTPPSPASGIRPWAERVQRQPVSSRTTPAVDVLRGSATERRSPCTSTRSIAADGGASGSHNTSPSTRAVSFVRGGPSSLPAGGRTSKATQHNRRRTDR